MEEKAEYKSDLPEGAVKKFNLPVSGAEVVVFKGKGKHARIATRMCDGDMSLYMNSLMSQLVEIDGKGLPMEDFDELDLKDYNALMTEVGGNFT